MAVEKLDDYFLYDPARMPANPRVVEVGCFTLDRATALMGRHPDAKIALVEPDPENFEQLRGRVRDGSGVPPLLRYAGTFGVHCFALAREDGPIPFYRYNHEQLHSSFPRHLYDNPALPLRKIVTVQGRTLRTLLAEVGALRSAVAPLLRCDLLLLNCEGAEIHALEQLADDAGLRDLVAQVSFGAHYSHVHIYTESRWTAACDGLRPYYDIVSGRHPTLPYFLFTKRGGTPLPRACGVPSRKAGKGLT